MRFLSIYATLGPVDLRNIRRDRLMAWMVGIPVVLALVYRYGAPALTGWLLVSFGFDLEPYYDLLMGFFVLYAPTVVGMVIGFLLLDERDDRVISALLVTPMPMSGYVAYRTSAPLIVGFVMTVLCYPLASLAPIPLPDLLLTAFLASASGPITALFLAVFSANKIAGFALVKVLNTINALPVAAYFLDMPWQLAAGLVPAYWPAKMVWEAAAGEGIALYGAAGIAVNLAALVVLIRRFDRVIHR